MSLPFSFGYGIVSIYSISATDVNGIKAPSGFNFGLVSDTSSYGITIGTQAGQTVLFSGRDIKATVVYRAWSYRLITEGAILATEK